MGKRINIIKKKINYIFDSLINIIYPIENHCILCEKPGCYGICDNCLGKIKKVEVKEDDIIISFGYYGHSLKKLILNFKYKKDYTAGYILSEFLSDFIKENIKSYEEYVLTYIPMTKSDERERGFNQCRILCDFISKKIDIKYESLLIKIRETGKQKTLNKNQRKINIKDAFILSKGININNKKIILIDDVVTTGSTLKEAYSVLKNAGAIDIKLCTVARSNL
ncbi:phosphoribosyltransferase family protein [Clostridium sp. BJN0001]|uniref:ComF family protein n=1 Tax=Clostridium sp. BJN0001 TaxID=2930219 RepID=UPI001FD0393C|nr:phosphoribosyltransferase family protein [Clostridium sp. BJN0001]